MRLTYWVASHPNPRLSIRSMTKMDALGTVSLLDGESEYGPVAKVVIEYASGSDLLFKCMDGDYATSKTGVGPGVVLAAELKASPPPPPILEQNLTFKQAMEHARAGRLVARSWWPWNHVELRGDFTLVLRSGGPYTSTSGPDGDETAKDWVVLSAPR